MSKLVQLDGSPANNCGTAPKPALCPSKLKRRDVVRVGSWMIFLGALGATSALTAACAGDVSTTQTGAGPGGPNPTPTGTNTGSATPTPGGTATPAPTATPDAACGCGLTPTGTNWHTLGLKATDVPMNAAAYDATNEVYLCHDAQGFYIVDAFCTHQGKDMGAGAVSSLSGGFKCPFHGATFDANGGPVNGVGPTPLAHWALTTDGTGTFFVDWNQSVAATCRC